MKFDIFLSYRRSDQELVRALVAAMEAKGLRVWWDNKIGGGEDWRDSIVENLTESSVLVILFSEDCNGSRQLRKELAVADHMDKTIIPVLIEDTQPKGHFLYELSSRNWIQAHPDPMKKLDRLVDNLVAVVGSLQNTKTREISTSPSRKAKISKEIVTESKPHKEKEGKSRRDFLPFRGFDLIPIAALTISAKYFPEYWFRFVPDPKTIDHEWQGWLLLVALTVAIYGALVFPVRYYLRKRQPARTFGMVLLSNGVLALLLITGLFFIQTQNVTTYTLKVESAPTNPRRLGEIIYKESTFRRGSLLTDKEFRNLKGGEGVDQWGGKEIWRGPKEEGVALESSLMKMPGLAVSLNPGIKAFSDIYSIPLLIGGFLASCIFSFAIYAIFSGQRALRSFRSNVKKV